VGQFSISANNVAVFKALPIVSTRDSNCAAKARSCSGEIWSRLGEEVMRRILPEQALRGDRPID